MLTFRLPPVFLFAAAISAVQGYASAQAGKVLYLGGGSTSHDPAAMRDVIKPVLEKAGLTVDYHTNESVLTADSLAKYAVMFIHNAKKGSKTDNTPDLTTAQEDALYAWVRAGHTVIGVHSANSSYLGNPRYLQLFGGEFTVHGDVTAYQKIFIVRPEHPAMKGLTVPPAAGDNAYWDEGREARFTKDDTVVLARAKANGRDEPWTWVRPEGKGWVYYTSSGHDARCWNDANFQKQIVQAVAWGIGSTTGSARWFGTAQAGFQARGLGEDGYYRILDVTGATIYAGTDAAAPVSLRARKSGGVYLLPADNRKSPVPGNSAKP